VPYVIVLILLILLSGFFSSSETAFLSLQRVRLEHLVREGVPGATRVSRLLDRPHSLLSAILVGNNLVNTAAAAVGTVLATRYLPGAQGAAVLTATIGVTLLLVVFGEVVPKTLALSHAFPVSRMWALPMAGWTRVTRPVVWALDLMTQLMLRLVGAGDSAYSDVLGIAELRTAIRIGAEAGALEHLESSRLLGALTLEQRQIQEIMTPRVDIVAAEAGEPLRAVAERLAKAGFLRLPVYDGNPDNTIGYVHVSDVNAAQLGGPSDRPVRAVTRTVTFESEHSSIAPVLQLMQQHGSYLVMLVDEFGTTSGLVTLEDIAEEVLGNLRSESGDDAGARPALPGGRIEIDGSLLLVDLSNELGVDLTEVDANTVAGLVLSYTHRFPAVGETVEHGGYVFTVLGVDERRITRLAVEPAGGAARRGADA
jgi:CBS domain containing-hemolysin-like protein